MDVFTKHNFISLKLVFYQNRSVTWSYFQGCNLYISETNPEGWKENFWALIFTCTSVPTSPSCAPSHRVLICPGILSPLCHLPGAQPPLPSLSGLQALPTAHDQLTVHCRSFTFLAQKAQVNRIFPIPLAPKCRPQFAYLSPSQK